MMAGLSPITKVNNWGFEVASAAWETADVSDSMDVGDATGTANTERDWTEIIADSAVTQDIWMLFVNFGHDTASATARQTLFDIGVDPAGGTSYTAIINNMVGNSTHANGDVQHTHVIPFFITAGSAIAWRVQSSSTDGNPWMSMRCYGQPSHPELCYKGMRAETIGTITNSSGVSVTPAGSSGTGTYTEIGTLTYDAFYFMPQVQASDTTAQAGLTMWEFAISDGTSFHRFAANMFYSTGATEQFWPGSRHFWEPHLYMRAPAGAKIYCRGSSSVATPDVGYNVTVIAISGQN
jgi:hypothetical protein